MEEQAKITRTLQQDILNGDQEAFRLIYEQYRRFVFQRVRKFDNVKLSFEDRSQAGLFGLYKAARTFDFEKGYSFLTYLARVVDNEIRMAVRSHAVQEKQTVISLNQILTINSMDGDEVELMDMIPAPGEDPNENFDKMLILDAFVKVLNTRKGKSREIVIKYFRYGGRQRQFTDKVSQSYVSRIIASFMSDMKDLVLNGYFQKTPPNGKNKHSFSPENREELMQLVQSNWRNINEHIS